MKFLKLGTNIKKRKGGKADEAMDYIGQLYGIERSIKDLTADERVKVRQKKSQPLLESFHQWLLFAASQTPPKGLLGKAINYTLNQWKPLQIYLDYGFVPMDNNTAENAIRPFVLGRKNWLFCDTVAGAKASAALYSLIETAKANQLDPFQYLKILFDKFPLAETEDNLRNLLPQYLKATTAQEK